MSYLKPKTSPSLLLLCSDSKDAAQIESSLSNLGHTIFHATTGQEGLLLLKRKVLPIVIATTHSPATGLKTFINTVGTMKKRPLILLAAEHADEFVKTTIADKDVFDFVPLPLDMNLLILSIEKALERLALGDRCQFFRRLGWSAVILIPIVLTAGVLLASMNHL